MTKHTQVNLPEYYKCLGWRLQVEGAFDFVLGATLFTSCKYNDQAFKNWGGLTQVWISKITKCPKRQPRGNS